MEELLAWLAAPILVSQDLLVAGARLVLLFCVAFVVGWAITVFRGARREKKG